MDKATSIVNGTGFYPSHLISLGEIIEKYGQPDFVSLQAEGSAEAPTSRMSLFWDELKMAVEMPQIDSHTYAVERTTTAEMVIFWMMRNISIPVRYRSENITSGGMGMAPISHDSSASTIAQR